MELTVDQRRAVESGEAVPLKLDAIECVVLRKDIYDRLKGLIYEDSEFDPTEAYPLVNDAMREDDAHDPWLESYQEYGR